MQMCPSWPIFFLAEDDFERWRATYFRKETRKEKNEREVNDL